MFLEVLLSVIILSVGIIAVYQPLLVSLGALNYADDRMEADYLLSKKLWVLENETAQGNLDGLASDETLLGRNKPYRYQAFSQPVVTGEQELQQVRLKMSWKDGGRDRSVIRELYLKLVPRRN